MARSQLPDLIICDVQMLLMDGYASIEPIQAQPLASEKIS